MDLLPPELRTFVQQDLILEAWCEVIDVRVGAGPCADHALLALDQIRYEWLGLGSGGAEYPRLRAESHTELDHVPCVIEILPSRQLVTPPAMKLWAPQALWLRCGDALNDRAILEHNLVQ